MGKLKIKNLKQVGKGAPQIGGGWYLVSSLDICYSQALQNIFVRPRYFGRFYGHNFVTDSNIMKERIEKNCLEKLNNIKLLILR